MYIDSVAVSGKIYKRLTATLRNTVGEIVIRAAQANAKVIRLQSFNAEFAFELTLPGLDRDPECVTVYEDFGVTETELCIPGNIIDQLIEVSNQLNWLEDNYC